MLSAYSFCYYLNPYGTLSYLSRFMTVFGMIVTKLNTVYRVCVNTMFVSLVFSRLDDVQQEQFVSLWSDFSDMWSSEDEASVRFVVDFISKEMRLEYSDVETLIDEYRKGEQPLLAPIALLKHHFREHPNEYIEMQTYLEPHPRQAGLRRPL